MMTVITRRYRETPMLESVALACLVAAAFAFIFADPFALQVGSMALLGLFGIITQGGGPQDTRPTGTVPPANTNGGGTRLEPPKQPHPASPSGLY